MRPYMKVIPELGELCLDLLVTHHLNASDINLIDPAIDYRNQAFLFRNISYGLLGPEVITDMDGSNVERAEILGQSSGTGKAVFGDRLVVELEALMKLLTHRLFCMADYEYAHGTPPSIIIYRGSYAKQCKHLQRNARYSGSKKSPADYWQVRYSLLLLLIDDYRLCRPLRTSMTSESCTSFWARRTRK